MRRTIASINQAVYSKTTEAAQTAATGINHLYQQMPSPQQAVRSLLSKTEKAKSDASGSDESVLSLAEQTRRAEDDLMNDSNASTQRDALKNAWGHARMRFGDMAAIIIAHVLAYYAAKVALGSRDDKNQSGLKPGTLVAPTFIKELSGFMIGIKNAYMQSDKTKAQSISGHLEEIALLTDAQVKDLPKGVRNMIEETDRVVQQYTEPRIKDRKDLQANIASWCEDYLKHRRPLLVASNLKTKPVLPPAESEEFTRAKQELQRRLDTLVNEYPESVRDELSVFAHQIVMNSNGEGQGRIQAYLYGAPGTGKTTFVKKLAKIIGLPFCEVSLSAQDPKNLMAPASLGQWGRLSIDGTEIVGLIPWHLIASGVSNPIIFIDEGGDYLDEENNSEMVSEMKKLTDPLLDEIPLKNLRCDTARVNWRGATLIISGNRPLENEALRSRTTQITFPGLQLEQKRNAAIRFIQAQEAKLSGQFDHETSKSILDKVRNHIEFILEEDMKHHEGARVLQNVINKLTVYVSTKVQSSIDSNLASMDEGTAGKGTTGKDAMDEDIKKYIFNHYNDGKTPAKAHPASAVIEAAISECGLSDESRKLRALQFLFNSLKVDAPIPINNTALKFLSEDTLFGSNLSAPDQVLLIGLIDELSQATESNPTGLDSVLGSTLRSLAKALALANIKDPACQYKALRTINRLAQYDGLSVQAAIDTGCHLRFALIKNQVAARFRPQVEKALGNLSQKCDSEGEQGESLQRIAETLFTKDNLDTDQQASAFAMMNQLYPNATMNARSNAASAIASFLGKGSVDPTLVDTALRFASAVYESVTENKEAVRATLNGHLSDGIRAGHIDGDFVKSVMGAGFGDISKASSPAPSSRKSSSHTPQARLLKQAISGSSRTKRKIPTTIPASTSRTGVDQSSAKRSWK